MMFENAREVQPLKKWMKLICERCIQKKDSEKSKHSGKTLNPTIFEKPQN